MATPEQAMNRHQELFRSWAKEAERLASIVGPGGPNWKFAQAKARHHEQKWCELVEELAVQCFVLKGAPEGPTRKLTRG